MNDLSKKRPHTGIDLLKAIARMIQVGKLYDDNNKLVLDALESFKLAVLNTCRGASQSCLQLYNGRFFLQEEKVPLLRSEARLFNQMMQFMERRRIFGWYFNADLSALEAADVLRFTRMMDRAAKVDEPGDWLVSEMDRNSIHWVAVIQEPNLKLQDGSPDPVIDETEADERKREVAQKTYHYALNSVKEVAGKLLANKEAGIRKSVRMVQKMVDIITEDATTFMALSTMRMYDDYTYTHSLNVALLAMSLGRQIGMKRKTLERLGLCGLFHDLGKIEIPKKILNKKGKLNDSEFAEIKKHSIISAMLILKLRTEKYHKVHLLVSPFEHHIRYDHSGYPSVDKKRPISLFGRILTIVDVYDAITSPRIYRPASLSPDQALGHMLSDSGKYYDPVLLKVFINMLGVYPVGTLLKLDTGEMGLSLHHQPGDAQDRPRVQLLIPGDEQPYEKGEIVDLSQQNPDTGDFRRTIVKSMHPATLGIQPAQFIL